MAAALCLIPNTSRAQEVDWGKVSEFVANFLQSELADAPSAFVLVHDAEIVFQQGHGWEDAAHAVAVDPAATVFYAASIGKLFTATAVMQLVERGDIELDTNVNRYLRRFQLKSNFPEPVTVSHLLTHTAGFAERFLGAQVARPVDLVPLGNYLAGGMPPRVRPPGMQITYSNHGMALAGFLVQEVSGVPFDEYVEQNIFVPLGMTRSSFRQPLPAQLESRLVADPRGSPPVLNAYPAGSLATTPVDMGRFLIFHLGGEAPDSARVLRTETLALMHRRHFSANLEMPGVALGFFESMINGKRVLFHTGDRGHHSLALLVPDEHMGFYLVYAGSDDRYARVRETFTHRFFDTFYPAEFHLASEGLKQDRGVPLNPYLGLYRFSQCPGSGLERLTGLAEQIRIRDGGDGTLRARLGLGGPEETLVAEGTGLFRTETGGYVSFRGREAGHDFANAYYLDFSGDVGDPGGAIRIAWYEDGLLHFCVLAAVFGLLLMRCLLTLAAPVRWLLKRAPQIDPLGARIAWRICGVASAIMISSPLVLFASLILRHGPILAPTPLMRIGFALPGVACLLGLACPILAILAQRRHWWTRFWRLYYGVVAIAFVVMTMILAYWDRLNPSV